MSWTALVLVSEESLSLGNLSGWGIIRNQGLSNHLGCSLLRLSRSKYIYLSKVLYLRYDTYLVHQQQSFVLILYPLT